MLTSIPSKKYVPDVGLSKHPRTFINVDFPEPDAPMIATNSPCFTLNETSSSALKAVSYTHLDVYKRQALTGLPFNQHPSSKILASKRSVFDTLYHEEGHLFHHKNTILDYEDMHVVYNKQTGKPDKIGALAKGFLESKEEQFIASTVSRYAKSSPLEFVAEVYARMLNGEKFGDDVMNLYNKYKGPVLPD